MEIELRCKAPHDIHSRLAKLHAVTQKEKTEDDEYFKFGQDIERRLVLRIRRKSTGALLTFKGSSKDPQDVAWQEWETTAPDPDSLKKLFLSNGLVPVVHILKKRTTYKHLDFEVNVDVIENLGTFVEVELQSDDVTGAKQRIFDLLGTLGISKEDVITKGYVPLMIEKNANK